jgi:hypothetical protein
MKTQKSTIILSIALVIVLVAAGYFYFAWNQSQSQVAKINSQLSAANLNISSPASIFDAKLHDLLQQHTFLLINTIRRSLDSSSSYNASLLALQNNINEVGTLLTPIYGSAGAQQLVNLWNQKTNIFINYSMAVKNNDTNAQAEFAGNASAYEQQVAQFWIDSTNSNPYPALNAQLMQQTVTAHMNDVKIAVDDWNAKNYPQYFNDLEIAYNQIGQYADIIAQGIINQNPQDF